ncbi:hypothetical protein ACO22_02282 [Paracoccidioides brasiliensis]|uniref:Major facilitator superfamily (MFS) profile domain-containing protein n=1 Tax=Paracoccidioides brasiliensis TaxID=121759 RepID=A0A1D2JJ44_PARBR|nr:hypothetical protein ACO22_02282 [Paracoccidioides brasiliensis]
MNPSSDPDFEKGGKDNTSQEAHIEHGGLDDGGGLGVNERALIRKIDWRLLPILGALYAIALIDRVNISNARVAGMNAELKLHLPSNIVLRKVGSANWLAFIAFAWGTVMLEQGFVHSWQALTALRFILGFFESGAPNDLNHDLNSDRLITNAIGFFPGCVYLISCWYVRYKVQTRCVYNIYLKGRKSKKKKKKKKKSVFFTLYYTRLAQFYLFSVLIGGFSSILAFGLMQMQGLRGYLGWRWIFIIEGLITQLVGIASWFLIVDFPDKAHKKNLLTSQEAEFIKQRIENDRADAVPDPLTWAKLGKHLADLKLWAFALMFMSSTMPAYAFAYFSPTIIQGMGYSGGIANLLSAPPVVFAVITAYSFTLIGDKYHIRVTVIVAQCVIAIVGLVITAYHPKPGPRYVGIFLGTAGCQGNIPAILAYQSNNIRMQSKRSVGSAMQIGFGAIGGILASTTFREVDAPKYVPGLWITTGLQFLILGLVTCTTIHFWRRNKQVDEGTATKLIEGLAGFKYTL